MRKAVINGNAFLLEMEWQFVSENQAGSRLADKGGVAIRHSAAVQFAEGNGESGCCALAAWVTENVPDGLVMMPVSADHCWLCGTIGGFIAPETDRIINKVDLPTRLELLEDLVPYDLYIIDTEQIDCEGFEGDCSAEVRLAGCEFDGIKHLPLDDIADKHRIVARKVRESSKFNPVYYAVIGLALIASGYMGYNWWHRQQAQVQSDQMAADQQLQQLARLRQQRTQAESYRAMHQPSNVVVAVKDKLATIEMESRGWNLEKVEIGDAVTASYKRDSGLLDAFLAGRSNVKWSEDGNSADLDLGKFEVPVPLRSPELKLMDRVEAITMMQRLKSLGLQGSLVSAEPAWANRVPRYPVGSGINLIFWRVSASFAWLEAAMEFLQQGSVAVASVSLNFRAKNCEIEGVIYAKHS